MYGSALADDFFFEWPVRGLMWVYVGESSASSDVSMIIRCVGDCKVSRTWVLPPPRAAEVEKRRAWALTRSMLLTNSWFATGDA